MARKVKDDVATNHWVDEEGKPLDMKLFTEIACFLYAEFLNDKANGNILEIGCGNGLILKALKQILDRDSWQLFGTDISEEMLSRVQEKDITLFHCDASRIPCEDNKFDLIYMHSVIQYFDNENYLDTVMLECLRSLRVGGGIVSNGCSCNLVQT